MCVKDIKNFYLGKKEIKKFILFYFFIEEDKNVSRKKTLGRIPCHL